MRAELVLGAGLKSEKPQLDPATPLPSAGRIRMFVVLSILFGVLAVIAPHRLATPGPDHHCRDLVCLCLSARPAHGPPGEKRMLARSISWPISSQMDTVASLVSTRDGLVQRCKTRPPPDCFRGPKTPHLPQCFRAHSPARKRFLYRLQSRATVTGTAHEDIATKSGHMRIGVHDIGQGGLVWRIDQVPERAPPRPPQEGQQLPMVMVGRSDAILFMNDAARRLVGGRVKSLDRMFTKLPLLPGTQAEITTSDGPQTALVAEVQAGAGTPGHLSAAAARCA